MFNKKHLAVGFNMFVMFCSKENRRREETPPLPPQTGLGKGESKEKKPLRSAGAERSSLLL